MTIVIVEDEPKVLDLLKGYFEASGHRVLGSETGQGALELLQRQRPDLLLLDLWLKGKINGLGVLKEAKQLSPQTIVIVITGLEESSQEELVKLGAAALVKKPIRLDELDQLVSQVVPSRPTPA